MPRAKQSLMTQKAYADLRGVTPQYVNKLVSQGKIEKIGKLIDAKQADAAIKVFQRAGRLIMPTRRADKNKQAKSQKVAPPAGVKPIAKPSRREDTATQWRVQKEKYAALKAKLEHEKTVGSLLERDQVLLAERMKNERIRSSLRGLPRSLAPIISRCASASEAESLLREELDRVLQRLADDPLGMKEAAAGSIVDEESDVVAAVQTPALVPSVEGSPEVHV